jgi:hypothetical protein
MIVGPSSSGKSPLLSTFMDRVKNVKISENQKLGDSFIHAHASERGIAEKIAASKGRLCILSDEGTSVFGDTTDRTKLSSFFCWLDLAKGCKTYGGLVAPEKKRSRTEEYDGLVHLQQGSFRVFLVMGIQTQMLSSVLTFTGRGEGSRIQLFQLGAVSSCRQPVSLCELSKFLDVLYEKLSFKLVTFETIVLSEESIGVVEHFLDIVANYRQTLCGHEGILEFLGKVDKLLAGCIYRLSFLCSKNHLKRLYNCVLI